VTPGSGLFTGTLLRLLGDLRPEVRVVGIGQDLFDYDEVRELAKVGRAITTSPSAAPSRGDSASRA
jgi:hypothetical protein